MSENITEVKLERFKFAVMQRLSGDVLDYIDSLDVSDHVDFISNDIQIRIRGFVYGERQEPIVIKYPRDWWQALKKRFASAWFLARYPVLHTIVEITPAVIYPNLKISLPNESGRWVTFFEYTTDEGDDDDE
jgi:hypothetical protein